MQIFSWRDQAEGRVHWAGGGGAVCAWAQGAERALWLCHLDTGVANCVRERGSGFLWKLGWSRAGVL